MLFIRNKRVMYEATKKENIDILLTILLANKINTSTNSRDFKAIMINKYNKLLAGKDRITKFDELIDRIQFKNSKLSANIIADLLDKANFINSQNIANVTSQGTNTKQTKTSKTTTKTQTSKYNSDDIDDIVDATINTETDTTSIDNDLIDKIKKLAPSLKSGQTNLLDPLKVGADVECDFAKGNLQNNDFYDEGNFLYAINVLIIILRGGKIRISKVATNNTEEDTYLWPTGSIDKAGLTSLLEAIVDYSIDSINENSSNTIYNSFMLDPKSAKSGVEIFNKLTNIAFNRICKSSQVKGDLSATVADKVLGPQKLNLLKPGGYTLSELREAVIKSINEKTGENDAQLINPELAKSLITMVNEVVDTTQESNISIEDLLFEKSISHKKITYTYKVATDAISKDEVKKALNRIMNDFGEVLGPLFLLRYLNGSERVFFGADYSEAMKDYVIERNGLVMGVSAKSIKGGNAPDIKPALTILSKFITSGAPINSIVSWQKSTVTFDQLLANSYVDNAQKIADAKGFFTMLINAAVKGESNKSTLTQQQLLTLVDYMCGKEDCVVNLCTEMGISSLLKLVQDGFDVCDKFFNNNDYDYVKNIFDKIANATGAGGRKGLPSKTEFDKLSSKSKLGYFISPLIHYAIDKANKMFGLAKKNSNQVDIISAVIRLAFNYKQIYLGVDCDDNSFTITLKFNQMDVGDWKFATKAMMTDPWKQGILITMV